MLKLLLLSRNTNQRVLVDVCLNVVMRLKCAKHFHGIDALLDNLERVVNAVCRWVKR